LLIRGSRRSGIGDSVCTLHTNPGEYLLQLFTFSVLNKKRIFDRTMSMQQFRKKSVVVLLLDQAFADFVTVLQYALEHIAGYRTVTPPYIMPPTVVVLRKRN